MDSFEKPLFANIYTPENAKLFTADFVCSSPWGDCDIAFTWTNTPFLAPHKHNHWELFVITDGKIDQKLNGKYYELKKNDAFLIRPADEHSFANSSPDYQQINFLIKSSYLKKYLDSFSEELYGELLSDDSPLFFKLPESKLQQAVYKLLELQTVKDSDIGKHVFYTKLVFTDVMQILFEQKYSYNDSYPQWLKNLLNELNKPNAYKLTTEEIVKLTPYSHSRLAFLFKKHTESTLNEYMLRLKLLHAKEQLRFTNMTTLDIAGEIGFSSLSHFNHVFKKTFGTTPSEYRSNVRGKKE